MSHTSSGSGVWFASQYHPARKTGQPGGWKAVASPVTMLT